MIVVDVTTELDASAEAVWRVLTDLDQFQAWNPFIREAHGSPKVGGTVHVRVRPSLRVPLGFHATVLVRDHERELRWRGHVLAPWLACGDHSFTIEPIGEHRVRFTQHEKFSGILPWLGKRLLERETRRGFDAMNHALGERARAQEARP